MELWGSPGYSIKRNLVMGDLTKEVNTTPLLLLFFKYLRMIGLKEKGILFVCCM